MNISQLWKLPVIYVCENNLYNEYTHFAETTAGELTARAEAFGIHTEVADGQDVLAVHAVMSRLVDRARRGEGPSFLLCNTYRFYGHHVGDINRTYYRSKAEEQAWISERDPVNLLKDYLLSEGLTDESVLEQIQNDAAEEIDQAATFAIEAPYPDPSEVDHHVYANG